MSFLSWVLDYKWVILFYLAIAIFIIANRKKFEFQAKIIALRRTKIGIKLIDSIGTKHAELIKIIGYIGIGISYVGMFIILGFLGKGLYDLFFVPGADPVLGLVLPGIQMPGSPIRFPLIESVIALFIVIVIHEFSHGIVARAHGLKIQNTGIVFFGPIMGAFVEPDEKKLVKERDSVKYSVYAAGPWSNILLWLVVALFTGLIFMHPAGAPIDTFHPDGMIVKDGITFSNVVNGSAAEMAHLKPNVTYTKIDGIAFKDSGEFALIVSRLRPNESATFTDADGNDYYLTTAEHPDSKNLGKLGAAYIGITGIKDVYSQKKDSAGYSLWFALWTWIGKVLFWVQAFSLGLGLANLLPLGPVDGGRMFQENLVNCFGEKKGNKLWIKIAIIILLVMIPLLFVPMLRAIF